MSWQSTIIRKPLTQGPFGKNWTVLLSAETKLLPYLKLPLPCIQMASSSILGILVYFPILQNILKRLTFVFPKCLWPEVTTQGGIPKQACHPCRCRYLQVLFCRRANCVAINSNLSVPENILSRRESILITFYLKQKETFVFAIYFSTSKPLCKQYTIKKKCVLQSMRPPKYSEFAYQSVNMLTDTCGQ